MTNDLTSVFECGLCCKFCAYIKFLRVVTSFSKGSFRLGNNSFGSMQGAQASYNPSGEILAMINQGKNMGLPNQSLGMSSALPPTLNQPGLQPHAYRARPAADCIDRGL